MTTLELLGISVQYDRTMALEDFSLEIGSGEFYALLGPSGCGKTTVLKVIAGLLAPAKGDVRFNGASILSIPAERRGAAMVFQKPLLFPYLTVAENIAFSLKMRGANRMEMARRVGQALEWVRLEGYERRKPHELSGGQEQRVALARALVSEPRILLLDEPFSALDETLRVEMRQLVCELVHDLRITTLFVTHDQAEALSMASRIALVIQGRIEQFGAPQELVLNPTTVDAARFMGWKVLSAERRGAWAITPIGEVELPAEIDAPAFFLGVRSENVSLRPLAGSRNRLTARLASRLDFGLRWRWRVRLPDGSFFEGEQEHRSGESLPAPGEEVCLSILPTAWRIFHPT